MLQGKASLVAYSSDLIFISALDLALYVDEILNLQTHRLYPSLSTDLLCPGLGLTLLNGVPGLPCARLCKHLGR